MKKVSFKSNTEGKIKKLMDGNIFSNNKTFITELFQNSQRAKAKEIYITQYDDIFSFKDDGVGLKNQQALFTFDYSDWDSTDEGFGIGFWSVLAIPDLEKITIISNYSLIECDVNLLRKIVNNEVNEDVQSALKSEQLPAKEYGFKVILKSSYFSNNNINKEDILKCSRYLDKIDTYYNDMLLPKSDLFDLVNNSIYSKVFNTRLFSAKLEISENDYITVYYENREVCKIYQLSYVSGIIKLNKNAVTLREPDRTSIVYNHKFINLLDKLKSCAKELYKGFISQYINDDTYVKRYERGIDKYLDVKDYEKLLTINFIGVLNEIDGNKNKEDINIYVHNHLSNEENIEKEFDESNNNSDNISGFEDGSLVNDDGYVTISTCNINNADEVTIEDNNTYDINNTKDNIQSVFESKKDNEQTVLNNKNSIFNTDEYLGENTEKNLVSNLTTYRNKSTVSKQNISTLSLKNYIKKNKIMVWVRRDEADSYKDAIALAEYFKIKVIIAKNKLVENFFIERNIDYIDSIKDKINITLYKKDIEPKTDKEAIFLKILEPIRVNYKLPKGFFKIANIEKETRITLNGIDKIVKEKNSRKQIYTYAEATANGIFFDRYAIALNKFTLFNSNDVSIGKNELKCIMYNIDTIAHELAHVLYHTTDNTIEHYKAQCSLQSDIVNLYLKY